MANDTDVKQDAQLPDAFTEGAASQTYQPSQALGFDAQAFDSIRNLVIAKAGQMDELKAKIQEFQDSLKNVYINDKELQDAEAKAKDAKLISQKRKQTIKDSPEAQALEIKIKELKEDLKDVQDSLSNQLIHLYQMTGVQEFETPEGDVREFSITARVKGKKAK